MRKIPGTLQGGGASFADTHWSIVTAAGEGDPEDTKAQAALDRLCHEYWPPLYTFVRRRGHRPDDAQDLVQGFFSHLLEHRAYARTDPLKGKFRAFLLASFKNYLSDQRDRHLRLKRGGGQQFVLLDEELDAVETAYVQGSGAGSPLHEERLFDQRWAAALTAAALSRLQEKYTAGPKARVFDALKSHVSGIDAVDADGGHDEIAARLGVPVETLRSYLSRMRARYRELLREEVSRTVARAEDVEEEMRYLRDVLLTGARA